MKDDIYVKKLVELIFIEESQTGAEATISHFFLPAVLVTDEFFWKLKCVLSMHQMIFIHASSDLIVRNSNDVLSSHHIYLKSVMYSCLCEVKCYRNIFECFLSVCAFLKLVNNETLRRSGIDFRNLNIYIFMVFYEMALKYAFYEHGGFQALVEYISSHRSMTWKWEEFNQVYYDMSVIFQEDVPNELSRRRFKMTDSVKGDMQVKMAILADFVLSTTKLEFPIFSSSSPIVVKCLIIPRNETKENTISERIIESNKKFENLDETCQESLRSDPNSKINHGINNVEEDKCQNIIQAVTRLDFSESSSVGNLNNRIQKKGDRILTRLKGAINSLVELLFSPLISASSDISSVCDNFSQAMPTTVTQHPLAMIESWEFF